MKSYQRYSKKYDEQKSKKSEEQNLTSDNQGNLTNDHQKESDDHLSKTSRLKCHSIIKH